MIVIVKNRNYTQLIKGSLSYIVIFIMFYLYYNHMSSKFANQTQQLQKTLHVKKQKSKEEMALKYEQTIYNEAKTIVKYLKQSKVWSVKVIKDRLYIICSADTDIEPLLIRYGVNAYVKHTQKNIKIAIDLSTIMEKKYD